MIPIARARKCGSTTLDASVTDSAIINEPLAAQPLRTLAFRNSH